jgi:hypothetical protein
VLGLQFGEPGGDVAAHLDELAPVINPAQLLQAVIGQPARQMVECVSEEVHIAALSEGTGQDLADCLLEHRTVIGDDQLDPE